MVAFGFNLHCGAAIEPQAMVQEVLADQIRSLTKSIRRLDANIVEHGKKLKCHQNPSSIKDIGERSATVLLSVISNVKNFANEDKLASYFGIEPQIKNSNETVRHGRITKHGSKLTRTTLVQCTLAAKRIVRICRRYYERIERTRSSGKTIIAIARNFLGIIFNTLKTIGSLKTSQTL